MVLRHRNDQYFGDCNVDLSYFQKVKSVRKNSPKSISGNRRHLHPKEVKNTIGKKTHRDPCVCPVSRLL